MKNVLVVAPHPDDETLGCCGTLLKHQSMGDKIFWLIMTNISVKEGFDEVKVKQRQKEIKRVAAEYGFEETFKCDFPTTKLDEVAKSKIIDAIGHVMDKVMPKVVYIPNRNDVHSDHKATFDASISATKTFRCPFIQKVFSYEVISETEFTPLQSCSFFPNSFSDITGFLNKKISIMKMYKGEMGEHPFPRSGENIRALATFRGATAGVKYAESFMVVKEVW